MNNTSIKTQKLLLLTSGHTGNNVFCTPAIRLLRKHLPLAIIDVVALNKLSAEVFENNNDINDCFVINKSSVFDKVAKDYSEVIVLNRILFKKMPNIKTSFHLAPPLLQSTHHAEQLLQFVAKWLGVVVTDEDRCYVVESGESSKNLLSNQSIPADAVLINIHLGCRTTFLHGWKFFYSKRADNEKLWPIEAYIALGNALQKYIPKLKIVITGTRSESFLAKKFEKNVSNTINMVGKTTVSDLNFLMKNANLFIGHDCGVFHVAVASGVPIVGLFGPTNPNFTGPYPFREQYCLIQKESMAHILTEDVVNAALSLLRQFPK